MLVVIGEGTQELTMMASLRNNNGLRTMIPRVFQVLNAANTTLGVHLQGHVSPPTFVPEEKLTKKHTQSWSP